MQQRIEHKALGSFEQTYRESCSLARAWGYTLLFGLFIVVWGVALLPISLNLLLKAWPLLLLSVAWFYLCGSVIVSVWQSYRNPEWISLYHDGFVYHEKGQDQVYHWNEVRSIILQYAFSLKGKNQSTLRSYQVLFVSGKTLNIVKGTSLKSDFERYQQRSAEEPSEAIPRQEHGK